MTLAVALALAVGAQGSRRIQDHHVPGTRVLAVAHGTRRRHDHQNEHRRAQQAEADVAKAPRQDPNQRHGGRQQQVSGREEVDRHRGYGIRPVR